VSDETNSEVELEPQRPTGDPQAAVNLRSNPPKVMRLSRKAIGIATAVATAFVGGALIYALRPEGQKNAEELYNTDSRNAADSLANAPKDYGQVPKLGAPLPGDLGKPILDAQNKGSIAACRAGPRSSKAAA
jgi:type IV secretion system protein VirB10